ncbi:LysE/ArgO family amino acid transporter [Geobacter sp. SVR]|uniref:LysE/ArgO family amino acid transporter n=1 Tax=Geobacter sp. SVR TaxID=2495594 RepID=UPI00143EFA8E|nr:LysE/ArgO family amino acid transporter [Geobacter sp. SVR]BCS52857.1 amino acid transporter [Geobacter sp. SVR]GCF86725.1 amino acid transporter [Geobacter sp. SVR]
MNQSAFNPLFSGFGLGASLIIAIGSQNAFVLRQGLKREFVFTVCTVCFLCDAILIALGAGGFGALVASSPLLLDLACWSGAAFLVLYGVRSFHAALNPGVLAAADDGSPLNALLKVVLTTLALTLLNPHVYLDTVLLLGSLAAQYPGQARMLFAVGAMAASFVWFFGLGYGARIIEPLFRRPAAWRILDVLVGCTMWFIAGNLVWSRFTAG